MSESKVMGTREQTQQTQRPHQFELDHEHRTHALLSASSSKQWLNCTPSARLQDRFPNESSSYAKEGTFMHEICEYKIRHNYLREDIPKPVSDEFEWTEEIEQVTDAYYEFVVSAIEEMKKSGQEPLILIEVKLNYTHIAPSGFGTGDMILVGKTPDGQGVIHVIDFKGGRGIFVDADHNTQMMLYALGALADYGYIWDIEIVRMTIVQPRLDNISTFECSRSELEAWGESIKPIARLAYEGKGEQKAGDWCRFCRAKPVCRACAEEALALCREEFVDLDAEEENQGNQDNDCDSGNDDANSEGNKEGQVTPPVFKQPQLISLSELEKVLPTLNRIALWIDDVFTFVSSEAINHGVAIKGYKVVEGRSARKFTDIKSVIKTATENGYTDIYKQELITLTEFEKLMGKKKFAELLGDFVIKPPGKLSLVPDSDPRPAVDLAAVSIKATPNQEFDVLPD